MAKKKSENPQKRGHVPLMLDAWLDAKGLKRKDLMEKTDWTPGFISKLAAGKSAVTENVLHGLKETLDIEYYEVVMPPALAEAVRAQVRAAHTIVSETKSPYSPEPPSLDGKDI